MNTNEIRKALRAKFGYYNYHITKDGEIHVYGTMPNTGQLGWYFYGYMDDAETTSRIETL